jgi:small subunit ribosomal protein S17
MTRRHLELHSHGATKQGYVVSDKLDQTCAVRVSYQARHRKYGKYLQRQAKYQVHDPENSAKRGDLVEIALCRPVSKTKSWKLVRVIEAAPAPVTQKRQADAAPQTQPETEPTA